MSHHVDALAMAGLAVLVFGRDLVAILRRCAAAGVRVGVRELRRAGKEER